MTSYTRHLGQNTARGRHSCFTLRQRGFATPRSLALIAAVCAGGVTGASDGAGANANESSQDELMAKGEVIYNQTCAGCHQVDGKGIAGVYPPLVAGTAFTGSAFLIRPLAERGFWNNGKIRLGSIENHIEAVLNGIPNSRMFGFSLQLNDVEIAAVVTYERNAWGNDSGDVVQSAQVEALR